MKESSREEDSQSGRCHQRGNKNTIHKIRPIGTRGRAGQAGCRIGREDHQLKEIQQGRDSLRHQGTSEDRRGHPGAKAGAPQQLREADSRKRRRLDGLRVRSFRVRADRLHGLRGLQKGSDKSITGPPSLNQRLICKYRSFFIAMFIFKKVRICKYT